jgi:phosphoribosylpyrophosphate synthetase
VIFQVSCYRNACPFFFLAAYATHGVFAGELETILSAKPNGTDFAIDRLVIGDTVPSVHEKIENLPAKLAEKVEALATAPMLMQALEQLPRHDE